MCDVSSSCDRVNYDLASYDPASCDLANCDLASCDLANLRTDGRPFVIRPFVIRPPVIRPTYERTDGHVDVDDDFDADVGNHLKRILTKFRANRSGTREWE